MSWYKEENTLAEANGYVLFRHNKELLLVNRHVLNHLTIADAIKMNEFKTNGYAFFRPIIEDLLRKRGN